ncbi:MAG: hypothetical protein AB1721_02380 [Patescibacteria group bacterium]
MVTQELIDYIKKQLEQGLGRDQIKQTLLSNGWQEQDVAKGFTAVDSETNLANLEVQPEKPVADFLGQATESGQEKPQEPVLDLSQKPVGLSSQPVFEPGKAEPVNLAEEVQPESVESVESSPVEAVESVQPASKPMAETQVEQAEPENMQAQPVVMSEITGQAEKSKKPLLKLKVNKSVVVILAVLLGGVVLGAGLILGIQALKRTEPIQPSPSPIVEVSPSPVLELVDAPYLDEELGIKFFYPVDWLPETDLGLEDLGMKGVLFGSGGTASINIISIPLTLEEKNDSLDKATQDSIAVLKTNYPDYELLGKSQTSVSGYPAFTIEGKTFFNQEEGNGLKMRILQLIMRDAASENQFVITFMAPDSDWQTYQPIYWQAINSLELI